MAEQETAQTEATEAEEQAATTEAEEPQGAEVDWKSQARKWEGRAKAYKAKADQWDAQEEAGKTELQKATERAEKLKAELDGIKAEKARAAEVEKAAAAHKVDAALLARMSGDVEENAKFLSEHLSTKAYPQTRDRGEYAAKQKGTSGAAQAARVLFARD
jgi:arylamine N-acetyltransferase